MQLNQLIFPVLIVVAFYFLLIRPQQQQAKKQKETVESLVPGKKIVTIGGIYATVVSVAEDRVRVAVADGSELEIAKRGVGSVLPDDEDDSDDADEVIEDEPDEADEPALAEPNEDAHASEGDTEDA